MRKADVVLLVALILVTFTLALGAAYLGLQGI